MPSTPFHERPAVLDRERHRHVRLLPATNDYAFAARTNALPVTPAEFAEAARHYPLVFVGEDDGALGVAALVGLANEENLMVDAQGRWDAGAYVPAFARRHPFVLASGGPAGRLTVCIDEACTGLSTTRGEALFDERGAETPCLQRVLAFLAAFEEDMQRARAFAQRLRALGLLVPRTVTLDRPGSQQTLDGLWVVDEARLRDLDDACVIELFRSRYLSWIEAHLLSLGHLQRLATRLEQRHAAAARVEAAGAAGATA